MQPIMPIHTFPGRTLRELAQQTHIFWYPIRTFLLADDQDDTGSFLMETFSVQQILDKCPVAADAVVKYVKDFAGDTILRVRMAEVAEKQVENTEMDQADAGSPEVDSGI